MKNLLDLLKKLKRDLNEANTMNYTDAGMWISPEEIHTIRIAIRRIDGKLYSKESFEFLIERYDFKSIYEYFFMSSRFEFDQYYNPVDEISSILDPLLIHLMDINYEVSIRKIEYSDKIPDIYAELVDNLELIEQAYLDTDFKRVTSLSSTVLQSLFKEICSSNDISYTKHEKFPQLYKKVAKLLNVDSSKYKENNKLRDFSSNINKIVVSLNEIRNLYSESHGHDKNDVFNFEKLPKHHIKLIVDTTKTIVNFFVETYFYQKDALKI